MSNFEKRIKSNQDFLSRGLETSAVIHIKAEEITNNLRKIAVQKAERTIIQNAATIKQIKADIDTAIEKTETRSEQIRVVLRKVRDFFRGMAMSVSGIIVSSHDNESEKIAELHLLKEQF